MQGSLEYVGYDSSWYLTRSDVAGSFWRNSYSVGVAVPSSESTAVCKDSSPHNLTRICCHLCFWWQPFQWVRWDLKEVLIWISFMAKDIEHFSGIYWPFLCFSFWELLVQFLSQFTDWFVVVTVSHSEDNLFTLMIVSFAMKKLFIHFNFILQVWAFCLHVCVCPSYMSGACRVQTRCWIPWDWSYRRLWDTMWELEIKPWSSKRAASTSNLWALSPDPEETLEFHVIPLVDLGIISCATAMLYRKSLPMPMISSISSVFVSSHFKASSLTLRSLWSTLNWL